MDIDEILEIHYASKFINTKSGQNYPIHYGELNPYLKQAIREIVKETLRMAAQDARMNFHDGQFKEDKPLTYFQLGVNNLQIDKDSITNLINKIKF